MKSLKDYSLNITEEEYHALPYWNHSTIARYAREGFSSLATLHEPVQTTPSMEFGSFFDSIITKGTEFVEKTYTVYDRQVPEAEKKVLEELNRISSAKTFKDIPFSQVIFAADTVGYQTRWKPETRYEKIKVYSDYFDTLASGKKIISSKDWQDAMDMTYALRSNPYTGNLFGLEDTQDIEYLYQMKFVVEYMLDNEKEVMIKFMPDLVVVNHKEKTIQPVDLKTSFAPAYDFKDNFLKYRYDIEAMLYADGLELVRDKIKVECPEYEEYIILPYIFVDISRSDMQPVSYVYDQTDPSQYYGLSFSNGEKTYNYKRWDAILEEILEYEETQAKVPNNIKIDKPNNILDFLGR